MLLKRSPPTHCSIPPNTPHSVADSCPTWQDNVNRALGKIKEGSVPETSYPRVVIHPFVRPVIDIVLETLKVSPVETCLLFPSRKNAKSFRSYMYLQYPSSFPKETEIHSVSEIVNAPPGSTIFAVLFHSDQTNTAMKYWAFNGGGISVRLAENCLRRREGQMELALGLPTGSDHEYADYYSSHSPLSSVSEAKRKIKVRFAGIIEGGDRNIRGVPGVTTSDVYLYSTGMQPIWHAHEMLVDVVGCSNLRHQQRFMALHVNVLFVASYNLLEGKNIDHRVFTNDTLDDMERYLEKNSSDKVLGIFTDFPGNPHLQSADLPRLRALADKYHIPLIVDDTLGCHLNVSVLPFADVVVASLTKIFSGFANILGGALLLNPSSKFYTRFKAYMEENYEDNYFDADALVMELNSQGFESRVTKTNANGEALADWLFSRSKAGGMNESVIEEVFYPKYQSRENYERCMRAPSGLMLENSSSSDVFRPGYGGLLSIVFTSVEVAKIFYDTVQCYKGATVGTVFTLLCPFNVIAVPPEKADWWVGEHDMKEALVRFSVGEEDISRILNSIQAALIAAERYHVRDSLRASL